MFITSQPRFQNEATAPESTNLEHFTTHTGEEEGCVNSQSLVGQIQLLQLLKLVSLNQLFRSVSHQVNAR